MDSIASADEINKAVNRSQKYELQDKPWMNEPEFKALSDNKDKFDSAESALSAARNKYRVSHNMAERIAELYG